MILMHSKIVKENRQQGHKAIWDCFACASMSKCCDDLDKVLEEAGADHAMHLTNGNKRHRVREVATYRESVSI